MAACLVAAARRLPLSFSDAAYASSVMRTGGRKKRWQNTPIWTVAMLLELRWAVGTRR